MLVVHAKCLLPLKLARGLTLKLMVAGLLGQYDLCLGPVNSSCAVGVRRQPCSLIMVESVTLSMEWAFSF